MLPSSLKLSEVERTATTKKDYLLASMMEKLVKEIFLSHFFLVNYSILLIFS